MVWRSAIVGEPSDARPRRGERERESLRSSLPEPPLGFVNFTGTAGVWRASAIEAAGGWRAASLARRPFPARPPAQQQRAQRGGRERERERRQGEGE